MEARPNDKTFPNKVIALRARLDGNTMAAAVAMGVSPATISTAIRVGKTTWKMERKAADAIERLEEEAARQAQVSEAPAQLLVSVPPMKLEAFNKVAAAMGLEMVPL